MTGTPPTLGDHPQQSLRGLPAPAADFLPPLAAVGAPSVVDPQGPDVLGDGMPNVDLLMGADLCTVRWDLRGDGGILPCTDRWWTCRQWKKDMSY
ncbi:hypothetical protein NDU88_002435 [Pleurodeles waltl]|uniref:Uncharacterized protein n=1 Tax=Pleurodeles waltl TaxID=8319 RepID=A0AAV7SCR7_PLEWA|nr:hypothetical protein NDU88_002435 [Pleurodeles waltl]